MTTLETRKFGRFTGTFAAANVDPPGRHPPLFFSHGAFGDHRCFDTYMGYYSELGYDCFAISRRGRHGVAPDTLDAVTIENYLDDTLTAIERLDRPPVVFGHSLGGVLAQMVAERGLASGLVLLATAPPAMWIPPLVALPALIPAMPRVLGGRAFNMSRSGFERIPLHGIPESMRPEIMDTFVPNGESGAAFRQLMIGAIRPDPDKVQCPVLVVSALADRIITRRSSRRTARYYGADLHTYDGFGHWLVSEPGWERVAADTASWMAANGL